MKYIREFVSILYFISIFVISTWVYMLNMRNSSSIISNFFIFGGFINPFYFISFIINLLIILIFLIYLLRIKNKNIYFSVMSLAISFNILNFIIFNFLDNFLKWSVGIDYSSWIIRLIIPIGLIILSIYFRDKYKKSLR